MIALYTKNGAQFSDGFDTLDEAFNFLSEGHSNWEINPIGVYDEIQKKGYVTDSNVITLTREGKINIHMNGFLEAGFEPEELEFVSNF